jgi:hypothetical protein
MAYNNPKSDVPCDAKQQQRSNKNASGSKTTHTCPSWVELLGQK